MRYVIAAVVACLVIGAGFGLGRHLKQAFIEDFRQRLRTAKAEGTLPKELEGVDLDTFNLEGWEVRLPKNAERQIWLADWLLYGWHLWVPATIIISMVVAYITKGRAAP
jgi:hypothetical protein